MMKYAKAFAGGVVMAAVAITASEYADSIPGIKAIPPVAGVDAKKYVAGGAALALASMALAALKK